VLIKIQGFRGIITVLEERIMGGTGQKHKNNGEKKDKPPKKQPKAMLH
jgi:hypothetical protein